MVDTTISVVVFECTKIENTRKSLNALGQVHCALALTDHPEQEKSIWDGSEVKSLCAALQQLPGDILFLRAGMTLSEQSLAQMVQLLQHKKCRSVTPLRGDEELDSTEFFAQAEDSLAEQLGKKTALLQCCAMGCDSVWIPRGGFNCVLIRRDALLALLDQLEQPVNWIRNLLKIFYFQNSGRHLCSLYAVAGGRALPQVKGILWRGFCGEVAERILRRSDLFERDILEEWGALGKAFESQTHELSISHIPISVKRSLQRLAFFGRFDNGRPNVLFLVHYGFERWKENAVGGTQHYVRDLIKGCKEFNFWLMARQGGGLYCTLYVNGQRESELQLYPALFDVQDCDADSIYEKIYADILDLCRIDLIHLHHIRNHTFDFMAPARERNIPMICTLHDYSMLCPTAFLLDEAGCYCAGICEGEKRKRCLENAIQNPNFDLEVYRQRARAFLEQCSEVFAPAQSGKTLVEDFYHLPGRVTVFPNGEKPYKRTDVPIWKGEGRFRVALVGGFAVQKGSRIFQQIIEKNKDPRIEWHIFGAVLDQDFDPEQAEPSRVIRHGAYRQEEIYGLLEKNEIHLTLHLSVCSETFCYGLSESWQCNIPALVTDIGALGARVRQTGAGETVPVDAKTADQVLEKITQYLDDPQGYLRLVMRAQQVPNYTIDEMCRRYEECLKQLILPHRTEKKIIPNLLDAYRDAEQIEILKEQKKAGMIRILQQYIELENIKRSKPYQFGQLIKRLLGRKG